MNAADAAERALAGETAEWNEWLRRVANHDEAGWLHAAVLVCEAARELAAPDDARLAAVRAQLECPCALHAQACRAALWPLGPPPLADDGFPEPLPASVRSTPLHWALDALLQAVAPADDEHAPERAAAALSGALSAVRASGDAPLRARFVAAVREAISPSTRRPAGLAAANDGLAARDEARQLARGAAARTAPPVVVPSPTTAAPRAVLVPERETAARELVARIALATGRSDDSLRERVVAHDSHETTMRLVLEWTAPGFRATWSLDVTRYMGIDVAASLELDIDGTRARLDLPDRVEVGPGMRHELLTSLLVRRDV